MHISQGIALSFGILQVIPDSWQILEINKYDFLKGSRIAYTNQNKTKIKSELPLL